MAVVEKQTSYTSRGRDFPTRKEAERHENLVTLREALETAQRAFSRALALDAVTADGVPFEFGVFCDYFQVFCPHRSEPYLRKFCFMCWNWSVRGDDAAVVEISDESDEDGRRRWVSIRELYRDGKKAGAALRVAQQKWLKDKADELGLTIQ